MLKKLSKIKLIIVFALASLFIEGQTASAMQKNLFGKKKMGIQFIWDGYGTAEIKKIENKITIEGSQYSKDKNEHCLISGELTIASPTKLIFAGTIKIFTKDCCGEIDTTGTFTFVKSGKRKYYRLQEFDSLCSQYTCAYYLDIFE
jgi:hypothetical protein